MSLSTASALDLLAHWSSASRIISINFAGARLALTATARIVSSSSTSIKFALRPLIRSEPIAEVFRLSLDGDEEWSEVPDDPLALDCRFKSDGVLTLRVAPERTDFTLEPESTLEN
jgi:hypothetical protein